MLGKTDLTFTPELPKGRAKAGEAGNLQHFLIFLTQNPQSDFLLHGRPLVV